MQANLVFSHFARPTPPLGISLIKAYVEKNSDFSVKCFDLSLAYRNDLADAVRNDKIHIDFPQYNRKKFLQAIDFFKNKNNENFFEQAAYNKQAPIWDNHFDKITATFCKVFGNFSHENNSVSSLENNFTKLLLAKKPEVVGFTLWSVNNYAKLLLANKPDVVGFSLMLTDQFYCSALISRILKNFDKNIKIVFGGYISNLIYEELLTNPYIDFVVRNEGEMSLLGLMKALNGEQELQQVPNLAFKENGKIVTTEPAMVADLDKLPYPDFSDFDLNAYSRPTPLVSILGSRGCYWHRCAFCVHHKNYFSKYRTASVTHIVDELEYHVSNGVKHFSFVDEMISAKRFRQIGEEIIKRKLQIYYYALAKPTSDFTKDTFEIMYRSGCRYVIWGVESGSQRILDLIDKGTEVVDMSKALTCSASAGLKNHVFIIIGFPSETKEELGETLNFLYENKNSIHAISSGTFSLHKGSLVYQNPEKFYITRIYDPQFLPQTFRYDVSQGLKQNDLKRYRSYYAKNYFHYFHYFSPFSAILRDHALFHYSDNENLSFNEERKPVPSLEKVGPPPQPVTG